MGNAAIIGHRDYELKQQEIPTQLCVVTGALAELKVKVTPNFAAIFQAQIIIQNQMEPLRARNGCRYFSVRAKVMKSWILLAAPQNLFFFASQLKSLFASQLCTFADPHQGVPCQLQ